MTAVNKNILLAMAAFLLTAVLVGVFYPKEEKHDYSLNIGAGADISGLMLKETMKFMKEDASLVGAMEFGDC